MRRVARRDERGMALALAIFALVVVGALVAGAFLAGHLEQRTGRSTLYAEQAADAAEAGAAMTIAEWDTGTLNALPPGATASFPTVTLAGRSAYRPTVTRLNDQLFLVKSLGTRANASGGTLARRTVAVVARLASLGEGAGAALTSGRSVEIAGSDVVVSGDDAAVEGYACVPGASRPAMRTDSPTSTVFAMFGDVGFDRLAAHASIVLPDTTLTSSLRPSVANDGRCDVSDGANWGEPRRSTDTALDACRRYYPIVYAKGSRLGIAGGGRGQGVLLVAGNLDITSDFDWSGLIVVKGGVRISGARTRITGALLAANEPDDSRTRLSGAATLQYSSCALRHALQGAAFAEPLGQRSWVQVY
jgi:hypothetical protein